MVGGSGVQLARLQAAPQGFLVALGPKRWTHDVGRSGSKVRVTIGAIVHHQMAGQHFAINTLAAGAGAGNRIGGFAARDVHDVDRHIEYVGNGDGPVHRLAFDDGWPRQRVTLGAGDAHGGNLFLQQKHQFTVFGVHRRHGTEFKGPLEAVDQGFIVAHDGIFVGHEVLEAVDAFGLYQGAHVAPDRLVPPGDGHVKAVVAGGFFGPAAPGLVSLHQALLRVWNTEVDDGGGAAGHTGSGAGEKVVHGGGAHERQLHVGVRVNAAGHHILAAGIDHDGTSRCLQALGHSHNAAILAQHITAKSTVGVDHRATLNQYARHCISFNKWVAGQVYALGVCALPGKGLNIRNVWR
ncbi:hypothetical protein GALL_489230 [mine drainage metagenome]|uniref:Uncharacterized protein n=1 Tax=mine drainage metagenome TaxID=410659 RepID=A0A1J5Q0T7_9ZZZZ